MRGLEGKRALVTGASLGIGRGIALRLAAEGADVLVNYRTHRDDAEEVASEVRALGRRALVYQADVADRDAVAALVRAAVEQFGGLDIAVANAGFSIREPVLQAQWENVQSVLAVNQFGVFHTCQFAVQQMVKQPLAGDSRGKILIVSSVLAEVAPPASAADSMAKAAANHFGRGLAAEVACHRINVNMLDPGWIDTPGERHYNTEEQIRSGARSLPWGRLGTADDVGAVAAFLLSSDADYVTGATLCVDGGMLVGLRLPEDACSPEGLTGS